MSAFSFLLCLRVCELWGGGGGVVGHMCQLALVVCVCSTWLCARWCQLRIVLYVFVVRCFFSVFCPMLNCYVV